MIDHTHPLYGGLERIARSCAEAGYLDGEDFVVWGVSKHASSLFLEVGVQGDEFLVRLAERDSTIEYLRTASESATRAKVLDLLADFTAPRGRGPYAGRRGAPRADQTYEETLAAILKRPRS